MIWAKTTCLICASLWLAGPAAAQDPLSAIPWLSETAKTPNRPTPRPSTQGPVAAQPIEITTLAPVAQDGIGLLPPETTGLPYDLWRGMSALRTRKLILDTPVTGVPATRDLFGQILLARTQAPSGSNQDDSLLVARIDRLIEKGRLDAAGALMDAAAQKSPALFRRQFDIALITDQSAAVCTDLLAHPDMSPNAQTYLYCLIVKDQWDQAEQFLAASLQEGRLPETMADLLGRFLSDDPTALRPSLRQSRPMPPLEYVLRDAFGLPVPAISLPLALRHMPLSGRAGLRERILAAEALTAAGALPPSVLFAAYNEGAPAASGGAWDRAEIAQDLQASLGTNTWPAALITARDRFEPLGLLPAMATVFAPTLAQKTAPLNPAANRAFGLILALDGHYAQTPSPQWSRAVRFAHDLGNNRLSNAPSPVLRAAFAGLNGDLPNTEPARRMAELLEAQHIGAALLRALRLLGVGNEIDPDDLQVALYAISKAGLNETALKIAVQTLVLEDVL